MAKNTKKILFIHHSTGHNLIKQGNLRKNITEIDPSLEFWDHSYNLSSFFPRFFAKLTSRTGLTNSNGKITGKDYNITLSNNSPKEYAEIFTRDPEDPTLKAILTYDIIAFKNCFPSTKITTDEQLNEYKSYYLSIKQSVKKYQSRKFILLTPPPLRKETTEKEFAQRAQKLVEFLHSEEFNKDSSNLFVFDFFGQLADEDGYLKKEYTSLVVIDSHPNKKANKKIATIVAEYIVKIANL